MNIDGATNGNWDGELNSNVLAAPAPTEIGLERRFAIQERRQYGILQGRQLME